MSYESRLQELGITLPPPPPAGGNYLPAVRVGNLLYLAGVICSRDGQMTHTGQVGRDQTIATAAEGARMCALNILANIRAAAGSLDAVKRFVTVAGYVNAISGFADSPLVINGASDFLVQVFGDAGRHARAAVAVAGLPKNSTVEIQAVVELV
jgi:enamine deaminase RidA (YjgF/YER057c/UK114 family)